MKTWRLALLAVAISIVALGVVAYAQQTVYVNGSYVVLLPNTTMSSLLEWLLNQTNAPVPQSGILIPVSDLPNVTIVTGYSLWNVYTNLNYTYITANWVASNMPSNVTATYMPSNAMLVFTVPTNTTVTNAEVTVNFTLGPWNYIIPNSVYGYEEYSGTYPVLWLPLTIWDNVGTYNFTITAFMTFPSGTTEQVPVIIPSAYPADIQIFLNPWNNSYDYYVFTYQNAVVHNTTDGVLVTKTTSYVDVGIPIGALLYSEMPVNITLVVTAFYNATTNGTMGVSLYMPSTSVGSYYTSESNYAYIADTDAGFDGNVVTSPLYLPNFTCYFNIVQQLFECYEGNYFVPVAFRGGLLTADFSTSEYIVYLTIEYPYYFYRFGNEYYYMLYPNGSNTWMFGDIGGYYSWQQTAPAYVSTAVGYRLVEAVGMYWNYPSVPNYQWQAYYTPFGFITNTTVGELFYGNYTQSDLANRLTFSVTAPAYSMSLTEVSVGGYTFWANAVDIVGLNNVTLGNTLTSGYSLVIVLNSSTLNIINTYKVPAGSRVSINLSPGNYLVINMIPTQYNATEANALNLTQNPQYYPFAWSFDPAAHVYYISVSSLPNATINLNATAYPLLLNVTVYTPSGAVNSSTVNMTGPTQLVVPQYSNVTIKVVSIPHGYTLKYTQWSPVEFTNVVGTVNYTYYLLPVIPINVTFLSLCPSYTLTIFNTFNGTTSTLQLGFNNTVVLYYNMTDTYTVTSYSSECKAVGTLSGIVTPLFNGQFVVIPLANPNAMVVPWYGYSIPQQYLNELLSAPLGSQLLILPPPPRTVDYYRAIPIAPLPWSNAAGFINADMGNYFNGYVNTPNGVVYINNSASEGLFLFPNLYYTPFSPIDAFLIYNSSSFPLSLGSSSPPGYLSVGAEVPYYVPAQMEVSYGGATPITIPLDIAILNINVTVSISSSESSCNVPPGAKLIYETAGPNGTEYEVYDLNGVAYECFLNIPRPNYPTYCLNPEAVMLGEESVIPSAIVDYQVTDTVTATVTLDHVVGTIVPTQFPINMTFVLLPDYSVYNNFYSYEAFGRIIATVTASRSAVSVDGELIITIPRGYNGYDIRGYAQAPNLNPWLVFIVPINIAANVSGLPTPETIASSEISYGYVGGPYVGENENASEINIGGNATASFHPVKVEVTHLGGAPIASCGWADIGDTCLLNVNGQWEWASALYREYVCAPWAMGGLNIVAVPSYSDFLLSTIPNIPGYNVTINAFVGGLWSWARQPTAPPGTEGSGLLYGGFPYPILHPTYTPTGAEMQFAPNALASPGAVVAKIPFTPIYVSNWTVINNVPNVYGTVMIPAAIGNSPNSVITATYTSTIPLSSFNNLAAVQVGETVQGLLNGVFTAIYKYGPYTYIVRLTATPKSTTSETLSVTVNVTRELLVNGEVVFMNTTGRELTNIATALYGTSQYSLPFPYSGFAIETYSVPAVLIAMPTNRWFVYPNVTVYAPMFNLNIRWDEEPMMVDSEILGGNYGTLQVTYILTEYPVKVTYNKTLIYAWYQGPNAYNYTVTQYLFPAVLITPSIYALVNATTQPINTFYALGYISPGYIRPYVPAIIPGSIIPINLGLSMLVAQDSISSDTMALAWDWGRLITPYYADYPPVDYLNRFAVPLIGLYIPPYGYPLMPVWPTYLGYHGLFWTVAISLYPYQWFIDYTAPNTPVLPLLNITDFIVNMEVYKFGDMYYGLEPGKQWLNNSLYALPLPDIYDDYVYMIGATAYMLGENGIAYVNQPIFANITITQLNGTDLICMRSNPLRQLKPVFWYPMNISEVVPSLDVGVYYVLGGPVNKSYAPIIYITHAVYPCAVFGPCPGTYVPILKPSGFFVPLLQVVNVTSLCFIPTLNGTYFIVVYIPPQSLLKSVYVKTSAINLSLIDNWPGWPFWKFVLSQISNASGTAYTPVLIVLTNRSFAMDNRDVVNPMSPDVLWLNIVQPQYVTVTTNLTALKLLFPNATITPFSVNVTSNGTLTSSGTGVVIVNASSTSPTPITYSGGASTTIMQVQ